MIHMKGDILFVCGKSFMSRIINMIDGQYSHIAIALSDDVILEAQRFTKSRITKNYFDDYDAIKLNLTIEQMQLLTESAIELVDIQYDYKQVLTTLFNRLFRRKIINDTSKYICSELVLKLLLDIGYINDSEYNKQINCTPNELYEFLRLKINI